MKFTSAIAVLAFILPLAIAGDQIDPSPACYCPPVPDPVCPPPGPHYPPGPPGPPYPPPPPPPPPPACPDPHKAVPLYRAYNPGWTDHFYTADKAEMDHATSVLGFSAEGITGYIFPTQEAQTVPLYRSYQPSILDHFYTVDKAESDNAVAKLGYVYEGITGYVFPPSGSDCRGAAPWYRAYNPTITDHFYTMSAPEMDNAVANLGYSREGIAAYLLLSN